MTEAAGTLLHGVYQPADFDADAVKAEILAQGTAAIKAVVKREKKREKKELFPDQNNGIFVRFRLKKPQMSKLQRTRFVTLQNPESVAENTSVCLILPDFKYKEADRHDPDVEKNARRWADILRERSGLTGNEVAKIYTFIQLQREVHTQEDKRKLVASYDRILVHVKLHKVVVRHLGKACRKMAKFPEKINVRSSNLRQHVTNANSRVALIHRPFAFDVELRFGHAGQTPKQLAENLECVLKACRRFLPGGFFNVRLAQIFLMNDVVLPIYVDFGKLNDVRVKAPKERREPIVDECSTLPDGLKVKILPSGRIQVLSEKDEKQVVYPTAEDEWEKHDDLKPRITRSTIVKNVAQQKGRQRRHEARRKQRKRLGEKRHSKGTGRAEDGGEKRANGKPPAAAKKEALKQAIIQKLSGEAKSEASGKPNGTPKANGTPKSKSNGTNGALKAKSAKKVK
ncbi:Protein F53F41 [Aphelenchoides fujianensis]|nr:Protein F53F41 [Aphelenchoides fujianensis]